MTKKKKNVNVKICIIIKSASDEIRTVVAATLFDFVDVYDIVVACLAIEVCPVHLDKRILWTINNDEGFIEG